MLDEIVKILDRKLCDHCLGRLFGNLLYGYRDDERGRIIRTTIAMLVDGKLIDYSKINKNNFYGFTFRQNKEFEKMKKEKCWLCGNLFDYMDSMTRKAENKLKKIDFNNFLVGSKIPEDILNREEKLWEEVGIEYVESIKTEINRELGKRLGFLFKKPTNFKTPDVVAVADFVNKKIDLQINSLYILGYYQKLTRGIPQCKWGTPGKYKTSVQEIIAKPLMKVTKGKGNSMHGCVSHDSNILLNECILPIKELESSYKDNDIISYNGRNIESSKITDYFCVNAEGAKALQVATEETGRIIKATSEHPFFTPHGMTPLGELKFGDKVAVYPVMQTFHENSPNKIIINESDLIKIIEEHFPTSQKSNLKELAKRNLLPLNLQNKNISVLARILGFMLGDACCYIVRNRDARIEFYEKNDNLKKIQGDIKKLGFNSSSIRKRESKSVKKLLDYYGNEKTIRKGSCSYSLRYESKPFWLLMVALGAPVGKKSTNKFLVPEWIMEASLNIKREFLSGLMGADGSAPRLDKRKHNKKSFNTPAFSLNKEEHYLNNALEYISQLKKVFKEFGIETSEPRVVPYATKKDGRKTLKIILEFNNRFENLLNLFGKINYRYCNEREVLGSYATEYLLIKKKVTDYRKNIYKKVLELKKAGLTPIEIQRKLKPENVGYGNIASWISPKNIGHEFNHIKLPESFPDFDQWIEGASKNLSGGLVWETIKSIEEVKVPFIADITVEPNHNFFANGFLVSNSGREDVNARCLGWRPFVIEIAEPQKRFISLKQIQKEINKTGKVRVNKLKFSDKNTVVIIKSEKGDKTYKVIVDFDKPVKKEELKKLKGLIGTISQQTPIRVVHRRADLIRRRMVKDLKYRQINSRKIELVVKTSAGLYVKELVSGDENRTKPSVSEILNVKATPKKLDVIKIEAPKNL